MKKSIRGRNLAAALILAGALSAPAFAHSADATIHLHGGAVGFIAGVHWGSGTLRFHGRRYPLKVSGLSVGELGASSFDAEGDVLHLHHVSDIEGTYGAVGASATAGAGAGFLDLKNDKGVEIHAHSTSAGLRLSAGGQGVIIQLQH